MAGSGGQFGAASYKPSGEPIMPTRWSATRRHRGIARYSPYRRLEARLEPQQIHVLVSDAEQDSCANLQQGLEGHCPERSAEDARNDRPRRASGQENTSDHRRDEFRDDSCCERNRLAAAAKMELTAYAADIFGDLCAR